MARKKVVKRQVQNKKTLKIQKLPKYNFIYRNFLIAWDYLKEIKNYVWFSTALFFLIGIIGYFFPIFFVDKIKKLIEDLVKQTQGLDLFGLMRFIIANNVQSAVTGTILGVLFAIVPLGIVVINGYVLGFVANKSVNSAGLSVLWRLLPHGIFEIPAIMISVALGIRLGLFLFIYHGKNKRQEFWKWFLNSVRVLIFIIIPLLVIAGIIEGALIWFVG
jgi:stage II sporulation protein M